MEAAEYTRIKLKNVIAGTGLNSTAVMRKVGGSRVTLKSIVNGNSVNPGVNTIQKIIEPLGITMSEFYKDMDGEYAEVYEKLLKQEEANWIAENENAKIVRCERCGQRISLRDVWLYNYCYGCGSKMAKKINIKGVVK